VALVVALLVFALCASLLVALQRDFFIDYRRVASVLLSAQGDAYLRGAEELAELALALDYDADASADRPRDTLQDVWAQEAQPYPLDEGGWLIGGLQDLQGRFNLNSLGGQPLNGEGAAGYRPAQQVFIRLLQAIEGLELDAYQAAVITESIADWVDPDGEPRINGAEASYYVSLTPSYRPADGPMASVSELRAVANVTPEIYRALRDLVTVWPPEPSSINIHTAPLPIIRALNVDGSLEPLSLSDGQAILAQREDTGFADIEEFLAQPIFAGASVSAITSMLGETSSHFLLTARVELADREWRRYSVLRREDREVVVLQRTDASLYDLPPSPSEVRP
jgi:general secretion pathway protein K